MKTLLLISQVYVPDPASVGQHMADAAEAMAARGWRVRVFTANRGYDNPAERFPDREMLNGVDVCRLPLSSLGKKTILHRLAGQLSFCLQAMVRGLFMPGLDCIFVTTSPPMGSIVGWVVGLLRPKVKVKFWVMDINPDQAVALGKASPTSFPVRAFDWLNRRILARASDIIVLDRFMGKTMEDKKPASAPKMHLMPPWPMEGHLERIEHADNPFRKEHGLDGKFVIMYSGNHSVAHPLDTILDAALRMQDDDRVVFLFIGGGLGKQRVEEVIREHQPTNIRSLPYQPLDAIKYSLSAADVHLVSMGPEMVGIVHPCKFYGAMSLAKPILLLGPEECHVADVLQRYDCGWAVRHGDVDGAEKQLREMASLSVDELDKVGAQGRAAIEEGLSKAILCDKKMVDILAR